MRSPITTLPHDDFCFFFGVLGYWTEFFRCPLDPLVLIVEIGFKVDIDVVTCDVVSMIVDCKLLLGRGNQLMGAKKHLKSSSNEIGGSSHPFVSLLVILACSIEFCSSDCISVSIRLITCDHILCARLFNCARVAITLFSI